MMPETIGRYFFLTLACAMTWMMTWTGDSTSATLGFALMAVFFVMLAATTDEGGGPVAATVILLIFFVAAPACFITAVWQ